MVRPVDWPPWRDDPPRELRDDDPFDEPPRDDDPFLEPPRDDDPWDDAPP